MRLASAHRTDISRVSSITAEGSHPTTQLESPHSVAGGSFHNAAGEPSHNAAGEPSHNTPLAAVLVCAPIAYPVLPTSVLFLRMRLSVRDSLKFSLR